MVGLLALLVEAGQVKLELALAVNPVLAAGAYPVLRGEAFLELVGQALVEGPVEEERSFLSCLFYAAPSVHLIPCGK